MRIGLLGAVTGWNTAGEPVTVGGPRGRTLLALLAADAGRFVSAERLIDGLYGEEPPDGAANALQSQVSRLRSAAGLPVEFTSAGYRLVVDPEEIDAHRFERLAAEGRRELAANDPARASDLLTEALALWRGPAFADVPAASTQATRLEELRAETAADRIDAEISLGRAGEILDELRTTVAAEPLRERLRAQLVRALHALGRNAEALVAFEDARRVVADELGADPGPELAEAHLAVLHDEPATTAAPLPAQLTSFVGRDEELRQIAELLRHARLVTLLGPGGTGKTRLAVEAGTNAGPCAFVELAPHIADDVESAVLGALGLRETTSPLRGVSGPSPVERIVSALRDQPMLLVLDNCEHVVAAAARLVARLLPACPGLRVLATSREPLGITGEQLAPVPRLAVPPADTPAAEMLNYSAVRLFTDRAQASDPAFRVDERTAADVVRICAALDGLPLALELAAARVRTLGVEEIAGRLDDRFRLLARGSRTAEARHRSLRGAVEWSWDLLDDDERRLARRLTVFRGGATLAFAEEICGTPAELLPELTDKSLVEHSGGRYRMLETIRAFCAEKLAGAGETAQLRQAHAQAFLRLAEDADPKLRTAEQLSWLDRLDAEYDNLVAALYWSATADQATALRLVAALAQYWWLRGRRHEGAVLSLAVLRHCGSEPPAGEPFLMCLLAAMAGDPGHDVVLAHQSYVDHYLADSGWVPERPMLLMLAAVVLGPPEDDAARLAQTRLARHSDPWLTALVPMGDGLRAMLTGDLDAAEHGLREGQARYRALGERWGLSMSLDHLSQVLTWRGQHEEATAAMTESMSLMQELGATDDYADLLSRRGDSRALRGDVEGARADYEQAVALARRTGMPETRAAGQLGLAGLARQAGDLAHARDLAERVLTECTSGSFAVAVVRATAAATLGWIEVAEHRPKEARLRIREAAETAYAWHNNFVLASVLEAAAGLLTEEKQYIEAATLLGAAEAIRGTAVLGQPDVARVTEAATASLGDRFAEAYTTGRELGVDDALTVAGLSPVR
ncbi:ATP-binding protein [Amycolatopsis panacis]|uniref:AfsR family transcriptional regulator n=1 Tax=Amycolatopsis panacis TaxID=2340917 RepID=A0A419I3U6_9PSEU|nr:BTAD domain-containing putative transcriptional regulator [Amycolatopsis panacis]RJQ84897.1 AfsR family transcriptional regulator [Amycolatopsis panacis]